MINNELIDVNIGKIYFKNTNIEIPYASIAMEFETCYNNSTGGLNIIMKEVEFIPHMFNNCIIGIPGFISWSQVVAITIENIVTITSAELEKDRNKINVISDKARQLRDFKYDDEIE